MIWEPSRMPIF